MKNKDIENKGWKLLANLLTPSRTNPFLHQGILVEPNGTDNSQYAFKGICIRYMMYALDSWANNDFIEKQKVDDFIQTNAQWVKDHGQRSDGFYSMFWDKTKSETLFQDSKFFNTASTGSVIDLFNAV